MDWDRKFTGVDIFSLRLCLTGASKTTCVDVQSGVTSNKFFMALLGGRKIRTPINISFTAVSFIVVPPPY